ncbi:Mrp/NBP35 family ATP-binding protein [Methanotorris formicicus]|uniref:Iron-sulfur cluster carrier protein n=1 Tax=Methanotorris formicicus Mc-S-70 TaxID=647171 RepID=H1KW41_9EURY|nr:Mrp/NBP35 family ATP-binding protein [Methanotorris formicicus]EHP89624.1 ATPase-like, ParA/MinD [Methanotorris formicicus Mc-S-70]
MTECDGKCDTCSLKNTCPDTKKIMEQQNAKIRENMKKIKHKIVILSGKGGVGKSTVTVNLASALNMVGKKVGVLDADIHGPNVPKMFGVEGLQPMASPAGIFPITTPQGIKTISIEYFLPNGNTPVIWRGPRVSGAIRQFLSDVVWGELDYLLIDTPPGTGDEQLTIMQSIPDIDGAIVVTTPEDVAVLDVKKSIAMTKMLNVPILGVIENMSGFVCPHCNKIVDVFGRGGGENAAKEFDVEFLGRVPLDIKAREASDKGIPMVMLDCKASEEFKKIVNKIIEKVEGKSES